MRSHLSLALLGGLSFLSGCGQPTDQKPAHRAATDKAQQLPSLPVAEAALDREALLLAVAQAASQSALGADDRDRQRELDGRRFTLRLRFGCGGMAEPKGEATRGWHFDDKRRVLTFKVAPEISKDSLAADSFEMPDVEAVEGFWIERPWVRQAACPRPPNLDGQAAVSSTSPPEQRVLEPAASPEPGIVMEPRVGIAQFFTPTDPRTHRRDSRPYAATKVLDEGTEPSSSGYDLVISGRLRQLSGRVIACRSNSPTTPPDCVIFADFDRVAIEPGDGGEFVAIWSGA